MTATIAFCSSIHTAAISSIADDLNCSQTVSTLGVSTFLLGFGSGPLIFAPLSEIYGRNPIYRITLLLFVLFNLGCALSPNIEALLIFRFLCGFFGSPTGMVLIPLQSFTHSHKHNVTGILTKTQSDQFWRLFDRLVAAYPSICTASSLHGCELPRTRLGSYCRWFSHRTCLMEMVSLGAISY